jgi:hypothetical protein
LTGNRETGTPKKRLGRDSAKRHPHYRNIYSAPYTRTTRAQTNYYKLIEFRGNREAVGSMGNVDPKCFESVTLVQPKHRGGAFKGPAKGKSIKADIRLKALNGSNRPKADIRLWYNYQGQVTLPYCSVSCGSTATWCFRTLTPPPARCAAIALDVAAGSITPRSI